MPPMRASRKTARSSAEDRIPAVPDIPIAGAAGPGAGEVCVCAKAKTTAPTRAIDAPDITVLFISKILPSEAPIGMSARLDGTNLACELGQARGRHITIWSA